MGTKNFKTRVEEILFDCLEALDREIKEEPMSDIRKNVEAAAKIAECLKSFSLRDGIQEIAEELKQLNYNLSMLPSRMGSGTKKL